MTCPVHQGSCGPGGAGRGRQRRPPLDAEDPTSSAPSPPGLESAHPELAGALVFAVYAQTSRHAVMVKYEHANLVLWTAGAEPCLWSPARRANPGIEPRARGPATGGPGSGPSPRADTGPESDTGLAHDVQICCKGARAPHALPTEPQNHAVSPRPPGLRSGLCNRFGQPATPSTIHSPAARGPRTPNDPEHTRRGGPARRARHSPRAESPGHPPRPRTRADRPGGRSPRASRPQPDRGAAPGRPRPHRGPPAPTSRRAPVRLSP